MNELGIVLVHGYMGSPDDLALLATALGKQGAVLENIRLPGHGEGAKPVFSEAAFLSEIAAAIDRQLAAGRDLVLLGHSTGGSLLLAEISRRLAANPQDLAALRLLVLCATPPQIDLGYAQRWAEHTEGQATRFEDIGALVALVNRLARQAPLALPAPVLIVHGEADELVPFADAGHWRQRLTGPQRQSAIPGARHHLFTCTGADMAIDVIVQAVADASRSDESTLPPRLGDLVPDFATFAAKWPDSARHLRQSPAGRRALAEDFAAEPVATVQPTIANIEITTRCNLGCAACSRTLQKLKSRHMARADFVRVLQQLPHAWRVVLVGLGEPLMHPEVIDFIKIAVGEGRQVGLVTNALLLDADMARQLCTSGLTGITFSLDAMSQSGADTVRQGSDMMQIAANVRGFMAERQRQGNRLGTSVFTALGNENSGELESIVDFVAEAGIDALMVSDLNFAANQPHSLNRQLRPEQSAQ